MQDHEIFCFIENEQKAFDIVKLYNEKTKNCETEEKMLEVLHILDNEIQKKEIDIHLYLNQIPDIHKHEEQVAWIIKHGQSFRIYLNTLKIIFLMFHTMSIDLNNITFSDFCSYKDKINNHKAFLNIIHN